MQNNTAAFPFPSIGIAKILSPSTYPWGNEDKDLIQFHKDIIAVHKMNQEFLIGSLKELERDYNVIGYGRFTKHGQSAVLSPYIGTALSYSHRYTSWHPKSYPHSPAYLP